MTTSRPLLVVAYGAVPSQPLLREEVARFHGVVPSAVVLQHSCPRCGSDEHGRPSVMATAAIRHPAWISVTHAGELSVVAVTDAGPVGVDVEVEDAAGFDGFDDVALNEVERASSAAERTRAWVRKEALLKAYGLGLAVDPRDVRLGEEGLVAWESEHPPPTTVWLRDLVVPGHVAAVAVLPPDERAVAALTAEVRSAT